MMLNKTHALALDGAATFRAVRAAKSSSPDPVILDAMSESGGLDTDSLLTSQRQQAANDAAAERALRMFGGG